ncbi:MAG: ABC transporter permease [Puniceicoccales bacterium]|jgi:putative ABC transport system permease protein|nr:ABC transporter permease [Puniceicoccales bacterium]
MNTLEIVSGVEIGLIYGIAAIGICLTFRLIDFPDMTCDGSFVLGAAISGILIKSGCNPWLALCAATLGGALAGLATGIIHSFFKISNLLSGILTAFMLYSINLRVMGGVPNIPLIGAATIFSGASAIAVLTCTCLTVVAIFTYLLATDFGLALRSVGQSKGVSTNYGVNIRLANAVALMLSNALIGLSGAIFNQHQCFADISQGVGTLVIGLAAVMIGEKLFPCWSYLLIVPACVVGSIVYRIFIGFALHSEILGLKTQDLNLITGLLIIIAMAAPKFRRRSC